MRFHSKLTMYLLDLIFILCLAHIYNSWNDKYNKAYELYLYGGILAFVFLHYDCQNELDYSRSMFRYINEYNYYERVLIYTLISIVYGAIEYGKAHRFNHQFDRIYHSE